MRKSVLVAGMLAAATVLVAAAPALAELKLGMLDVPQVTNNYERSKDAEADFLTQREKLKAEAAPKVQALEQLREKRDQLNKGTKAWQDADEELLKAQVEVRNWVLLEQVKIDRAQTTVLLEMYREVTRATERLAKEKGLDIVFTEIFLAPPRINVEEAQNLEDLKQRIVNQKIVYPSTIVDLTQDVLKVINGEYKARKGGAAPAAPAAPKG